MRGVYRKITASVIQSDAEMEFDGSLVELQKLERVQPFGLFSILPQIHEKQHRAGVFPAFSLFGCRGWNMDRNVWVVVATHYDPRFSRAVRRQSGSRQRGPTGAD